jgi:hypothetical protein
LHEQGREAAERRRKGGGGGWRWKCGEEVERGEEVGRTNLMLEADEGMKFLIDRILEVAKTNTPLKPDGSALHVSKNGTEQAGSSEKGCCNL